MQLDKIIAVRNNKTVFSNEGLCYKVFGASFSKSDVFGEALNQIRAEEAGLFVPKVLEVTDVDGRWAIVSEYIEEKPLSFLMKENPKKRAEYLELFVDAQLEIQKKSCPFLPTLEERLKSELCPEKFSKEVFQKLSSSLERLSKSKSLCHGDYDPSNVIVRDGAATFVIDWAHAFSGDALFDAAKTYLRFLSDGERKTAEEYLELFCEKSETPKREVEKRLLIAAASRFVEGNAEERDFLAREFDFDLKKTENAKGEEK